MIKRYDIYCEYDGWIADEDETGEFVRFEDVESLITSHQIMRKAMQEFVDRCDTDKVLSKYTYTKFKEILSDNEQLNKDGES